MKRSLLIGALILLVVVGALALMIRVGPDFGLGSRSAESESPTLESPEYLARSSREDVALEPSSISTTRALEPGVALSGTITDSGGSPVVGASISWTPIDLELVRSTVEHVLSASAWQTSDQRGEFVFIDLPDPGGRESIVWITHPDHRALSFRLPAERESWIKGKRWMLEDADATAVRVQEGQHASEGAIVQQRNLGDNDIARLLVREVRTGPSGEARLSHFPDTRRLQAVKDDLQSSVWHGVPDGTVVLQLLPTFVVGGAIIRDPSSIGGVEVICGAVVGSRRIEMNREKDLIDEWGPMRLPIIEGAFEYVVRVEGSAVTPLEETLRAPEAGGSYTIDFRVTAGLEAWFLVLDEQENVLKEATATLRWMADDRYVTSTTVAREDGYILVQGLPPGVIEGKFQCPGFGSAALEPFALPESEPSTRVIILPRGGMIRGRCLSQGKPVRNFQVSTWPINNRFVIVDQLVNDSKDGSFVIETALGENALVVGSVGIGFSEVVRTVVTATGGEEIVIELPTGTRASGRVADAATGLPVQDARVQVAFMDGGFQVGSAGLPQRADAEGAFRIEGLPLGRVAFVISAPGFSPRSVLMQVTEQEPLDLGVIRLGRMQPLLVRVLSDDPLLRASCIVQAIDGGGTSLLPPTRLDINGHAAFDSVVAGLYGFMISLPDGSRHKTDIQLVPGKEWVVDFDLRGSARIEIEVVPDAEHPLPPDSDVVVSSLVGEQFVFRSAHLSSARKVVIGNLPAGEMQIDVRGNVTQSPENLGTQRIHLQPNEERGVRIALGEGDRVIRVVDESGRPIEGVSVVVELEGSHLDWGVELITDVQGRCTVQGLSEGVVILHLNHATRGHRWGVRMPLSRGEEELEVVLDGRVDVELVFVGKRGPIVGVQTALSDPDERYQIDGPFTDDGGKVVWNDLAEGEYLVVVDDPEYWPMEARVQVVRDGGPQFFALRRRCRIEVRVRQAGLPRAHMPIALHYVDSGSDVATFIQGSWVRSSTGTLSTDTLGTLLLEGTPEGDYRWTVLTDDAGELSGNFTAAPGENAIAIELP